MSLTYVKSNNISVFPCAYRDPKYKKARFTTEENLTNLTNITDNKSNYLYAYMLNSTDIVIYIDGYRFVTTLKSLKEAVNITDLKNETIYAGIKYNYSEDIGRYLSTVGDFKIPQSSDINDALEVGVVELGQVEVSQHTILDAGIEDTEVETELYFGGIAFTTQSADFDPDDSNTRYIALNFDDEGNLSNKILTLDDQNVRNSSSDLPISELFTTKRLQLSGGVSAYGAYIYSKLYSENESKVIIEDVETSEILSLPSALPDSYKDPDKRFLWVKQYSRDYPDFENSWVDEKDLKPRAVESDNSQLHIHINSSDRNCWGKIEDTKHASTFLDSLEVYVRSFLTLSETTYSNISDVKLNFNSGIIPISLNISDYGHYNTYKEKLPVGLEKSAVGHISYQYVPYKIADGYVEAAKCDLTLNVVSEADVNVSADGAYHVVFYVLYDSAIWNKWSFNGSMSFNINNKESFADTSAQICLTDLAECFDNSDIKVKFNLNDKEDDIIYSYQLLPLSEYITKYKTVDNYIAMKSFEELLKKLNPQSLDVVYKTEGAQALCGEVEDSSINYYRVLLMDSKGDNYISLSTNWLTTPSSLPNLSADLGLDNFYVFAKTNSAKISKLSYIDFHTSNTKSVVKIYENSVYNPVSTSSDNDYSNLPYKIFYFDANARIDARIEINTEDSEYQLWHVYNVDDWQFENYYTDAETGMSYALSAGAWSFDTTVDLSDSKINFIINADNMISENFEIGEIYYNEVLSKNFIDYHCDFTALNVDIDSYTSGWYTSNATTKNLPHMLIDCSKDTDFNFNLNDLNEYINSFGLGKSQTFELINLPNTDADAMINIGLPGYKYDVNSTSDIYNPLILPDNEDEQLPDNVDCFEREKYSFIEGTNVVGNITRSSDGALLIELTDIASGNKWSRKKSCVANATRNGVGLKEAWSDWRCQGGFIEIPIGYTSITDYSAPSDYSDPTHEHYFSNGYMNVYKPQRHIEALIRSLQNSIFNISLSGGLPAFSSGGHSFNDSTRVNVAIDDSTKDVVLKRWSYGILTITSDHSAILQLSSILSYKESYESILFNIHLNDGRITWVVKEAVDQENLPKDDSHYRKPVKVEE